MEALSAAGSVIAVVQLIQTLITGLKILGSLRDAPADALRLSEELSDLQLVLQQAGYILDQLTCIPKPLKDHLNVLVQRTEDQLRALDLLLRKNIFKGGVGNVARIAWLRQNDRIKTLRGDIRESKLNLSLLATSATLCSISTVAVRLDGIEKDALPQMILHQQAQAQLLAQIHDQQLLSASAQSTPSKCIATPSNATSLSLTWNMAGASGNTGAYQKGQHKCASTCSCICHKPVKLNSSPVFSRLVGSIHFKYRELPGLAAYCNERNCKRLQNGAASLTYMLPPWLLHRMVSVTYSPRIGLHMVLRAPRIVADDAMILRHAAAGDVQGIKDLISKGIASPGDVGVSYGMTALHIAFVKKDIDLCRFLMQHGADPSYETTLRRSVLDIVRDENINGKINNNQMIELSCIFDEIGDYESFQLSPLHKSILGISSIDLEAQLAVSTSYIDTPDSLGRTALSAAAWRGDVEAVRTLLKYNASANICTPTELSPLHRAIESQSYECVELLVEHNADVNHPNKRGRTPLHYACRIPDGGAIALLLLNKRANVDAVDHGLGLPLHEAIINHQLAQLNLLLPRCQDIDAVNANGKSAFHLAICYNNVPALKSLLAAKADARKRTRRGSTVLHMAARFANIETMQTLGTFEGISGDVEHANINGLTAQDMLHLNLHDCEDLRDAFSQLSAKFGSGSSDAVIDTEDEDDEPFEDASSQC